MTTAFEARRFRSTAAYYARYRIPYPDRLIERITQETGFRPGERLIDLGCGPAQLAIAFARLAGASAIGIDPEPEMLDAAAKAAQAAGVVVDFVNGSSYDLGPHLAPVAITVMGRSFHWMDRPATLAALNRIIRPEGSVVLFGDRTISATPAWRGLLDELSARFSPRRDEERQIRRSAAWVEHEAVLLQSPFSQLTRIGVVEERHWTADDLVGRAFSMSVTPPQALGKEARAFEDALREGLAALSPDDRFTEIAETFALVAKRPEA